MRKTKFLPKTPTCLVCMPHAWTRTPTNHRTLSNRLQPISPHVVGETERTFFSCGWHCEKKEWRKLVQFLRSNFCVSSVVFTQQQSSKAAKHNHGRLQAASYWKADAAIIVMWRNVFQPLFSFSGQFSLCFSAFAQAHFPFLKQASQRPSSVQLRASSVVTLPYQKLGKDEAAWTSFLSKTIRRPNDLSC